MMEFQWDEQSLPETVGTCWNDMISHAVGTLGFTVPLLLQADYL